MHNSIVVCTAMCCCCCCCCCCLQCFLFDACVLRQTHKAWFLTEEHHVASVVGCCCTLSGAGRCAAGCHCWAPPGEAVQVQHSYVPQPPLVSIPAWHHHMHAETAPAASASGADACTRKAGNFCACLAVFPSIQDCGSVHCVPRATQATIRSRLWQLLPAHLPPNTTS